MYVCVAAVQRTLPKGTNLHPKPPINTQAESCVYTFYINIQTPQRKCVCLLLCWKLASYTVDRPTHIDDELLEHQHILQHL